MEAQEYQNMSTNEESHWWFVARKEILGTLIKKFCPKRESILEVGSGTGGNLPMLLEHGKVVAIEPNEFARKKISEKFGDQISLIDGKLPDNLNLKNQKFDLICLFDVLEHIKQDRAALLEIKKFLNRDGRIILTVPAFQFLWSNQDKKLHRFRRYNRKNLRELLESCNLEIVEISYFNFFLFPLALLARFFSKKSGSEKPNYFLNELFREIFLCEKFFLEKGFIFPFGLSLFCVLKSTSKTR